MWRHSEAYSGRRRRRGDTKRNLLARFLRAQGFDMEAAKDSQEALKLLESGRFDLVLSDVSMPGMNGIALLSEIRKRFKDVGVLMLTGCEDVSLAVEAMKNGALDYVQKPFDLGKVSDVVCDALARQERKLREAAHLRDLQRLVADQSAEMRRLVEALHDSSEVTLEALGTALDARERETQAHSRRVSEYAVYLAATMGIGGEELEVIRRGAMLHDIGKIGISDTILLKPGPLSASEWAQIHKHPEIGYWILNGIQPFQRAAQIVLCHHEHYDGCGYPRNLKGDEIPLGARIFSVVDGLDAMTSDRPYQRGKSYEEARSEILRNSGTQFDPSVVQCFLAVPPAVWQDIRDRTLEEMPRLRPEINPLVLT